MSDRPVVLWTERPVLLERERVTHEWMIANLGWISSFADVVYDNEPGDWTHYSDVFRKVWNLALQDHRPFINVESDVVPTRLAFEQVLACREKICTIPYEINHFDGIEQGKHLHGAAVERRIPGGWDSHFAQEGEEWAAHGDLGFIRFRPDFYLPDSWRLTNNDGMLNLLIFGHFQLQMKGDYNARLHLHWPALINNHVYWDEADFRHHPEWQWDTLSKLHRRYVDPKVGPGGPPRPP